MIYTSIKYLRIGLVIAGFFLIVSSVFLPFYSSCKWNSDESGTIPFFVFSYESKIYWDQFLYTILIFLPAYYHHEKFNKVLLYVFSSMFLLFVLLYWNAPNWGATPCVRSAEIGQVLSLFGTLFIMLGTFISIYREKE